MSIDRYPLGKLLVAVRSTSKDKGNLRPFVDSRHTPPLLLDKAMATPPIHVDTNLLFPPGPSTCIKVQSFVERRLIILPSDSISLAALLFVPPPLSLSIYYAASTSIDAKYKANPARGFPTEIESCPISETSTSTSTDVT